MRNVPKNTQSLDRESEKAKKREPEEKKEQEKESKSKEKARTRRKREQGKSEKEIKRARERKTELKKKANEFAKLHLLFQYVDSVRDRLMSQKERHRCKYSHFHANNFLQIIVGNRLYKGKSHHQ